MKTREIFNRDFFPKIFLQFYAQEFEKPSLRSFPSSRLQKSWNIFDSCCIPDLNWGDKLLKSENIFGFYRFQTFLSAPEKQNLLKKWKNNNGW